jgi:hypothetical protein
LVDHAIVRADQAKYEQSVDNDSGTGPLDRRAGGEHQIIRRIDDLNLTVSAASKLCRRLQPVRAPANPHRLDTVE